MSSDLDRMFGALRHDADAIPLGPASTARRRGERRRRTRLIAATAAVACLVGAGLTGGTWLARRDAAPQPAHPPRPLTDVIPIEGNTDSFVPSATSGDRVLLAWRTRGQLAVQLADLETGRPVQPARTLGGTRDYPHVVGLPWAFVAIGDGPDSRAYILDPRSGDLRWSLPMDDETDDLLYHRDALVAVVGGVTLGLDWDTGARLWELRPRGASDRPSDSLGMFTPGDPLPRDLSLDADAFGYARPLADDRMLQLTAGGTLLVRDAGTGAELGRRPGILPATPADYVAFDGQLYVWRRSAPFRLTVTDVDGDALPREIYRSAGGRFGSHVVPCGTGRVCFVESTGDMRAEVVAIEASSGRVAWRTPAPGAGPSLLPAGDRLLVSAQDRASALLDENGRPVSEQQAPMVWLSTGSLLVLGREELVEVSAADGSERVLGISPEGRWLCSSWTPRRLVCQTPPPPGPSASPASSPPDGGGFQIWAIGK